MPWSKERRDQYRAENRDRVNELRRAYYSEHREQIMLTAAKARAKKSGIECTIEESDIVIPERCPYLDIEIKANDKMGPCNTSPTLDRIDPRLGYVPGNVQVISHLANRMKNEATPEQLVKFARSVLRFSEVVHEPAILS